ncbi:MAG: arylsulfatase, partial [Planctomycetes bacterium]|nr:arylsulfatase [Planctomycetota bacterium]
KDGMPGKDRQEKVKLSLFDMKNDPHETTNVLAKHPDIANRLKAYAEQHRKKFYAKK